ncbi:MJ1255/VC2487 family glycosyltransferase [Gilvimarinus algae]|uniref:Glycosyltransferase family protein n=1 Tax=Gilvimarinus algae TaxID=3058037 RepID=A0ABT8TFU9_9GAMM|nr:MJ1255/VC2487 family glycosyltransferase [Gilvimarinus sp. SDUM040014]MDO3382970.1 glycosyltransferase family protein [Gilvimarinus sp. SDUM040014]
MRVLYGVQGTGNGHLTRARSMARAFSQYDLAVDWVFSGREREDFFDMDVFGEYRCYKGLTLQTRKGKVNMPKTILKSDLLQLSRDIRALNTSDYDLVISDFEPVTAWAARHAGVRSIGISHQCAFLYPIPKRDNNIFTDAFMRLFAPIDTPVGVHWHHFDQPLLPPIVEPSDHPNTFVDKQILVYLPFADLEDIVPLLEPFTDHEFYVYHKLKAPEDRGHIHLRPFSRHGFQHHLHSSEGVICSAGFELPSEAIQLGKKLLAEPVIRQMEQQSNALALQALGYATTTTRISREVIADWLPKPRAQAVSYPDVAAAIAGWIVRDKAENLQALSESLWRQVPGVDSNTEAANAQQAWV